MFWESVKRGEEEEEEEKRRRKKEGDKKNKGMDFYGLVWKLWFCIDISVFNF